MCVDSSIAGYGKRDAIENGLSVGGFTSGSLAVSITKQSALLLGEGNYFQCL